MGLLLPRRSACAALLGCLALLGSLMLPCVAALADNASDPVSSGHGAHGDHAAAPSPAPSAQDAAVVGVTEKLGAFIAPDVTLQDEDGKPVALKDALGLPTILAPVYYSCPNECNLLLGTLAQALPKVSLTPGRDYQILAVSFDDLDTPAMAKKRKNDFLPLLGKDFPVEHFKFLTGDKETIKRLMDSLGFSFQRSGQAFKHSVVLIALSPQGKVTRYLYGVAPMPFDIAMAATEAAEGKLGLSVKRALAFCYSYDPQGRKYVFDLMKVAAVSILFALGLFLLFLLLGGRRPKR